ncbi:MAG: hypothetical protein JWO06_500 [Bacteroidota bacterium]|nr:hypothetical protein [Bacteroidota bacterium]
MNKPARQIFKDEKLNAQYLREGYVIADLFSEAEVKFLLDVYESNRVDEQETIELTVFSTDKDKKLGISKTLSDLYEKKFKDILISYETLYAGYAVKRKGKSNESKLHRDPAFTDEINYFAVTLFIPLCDVDETNGALSIIPRSHHFLCGIRGRGVREYQFNTDAGRIENAFGKMFKMKKGQVLFYDPALLHFSAKSDAEAPRITANGILVPSEIKPINYYLNNKTGEVEVYEIDKQFIPSQMSGIFVDGVKNYPLKSTIKNFTVKNVGFDEFKKEYNRMNPTGIKYYLRKILNRT